MDVIEYHPMLRHDHSTAGAASQCCVGSPPARSGAVVQAGPVAGGGHAEARGQSADGASVVSPLAPGRVERALLRGPQRHGFRTDLWTLPRVATVIERLTGVHYHAGHVWYILRGLRWSLQRPARQARERDEPAIRQWIASRWPAVKKTPGAGAPGSSSKTKAGSRSSPSSGAPGRRAARPRS